MAKKTIVKRNEEQRNPSAFNKFRNQHDARRDAGDEGAESIHECALQPTRTAIFPPMHDHAGLREREGEKRADGIERDQPVGDAAEKNEHATAQHGQDDDAIGVDQSPAAVAENMREVVVLRDGAAETRKISEGGIGGQRENDEDRADGQIVKKTFAENRGGEHGENALVPGLTRIGCGNSVSLYQIGNSRQQHRQEKNNHGESALGIFDCRLPESLHAVADSFHAGQGRATAGENLQQQPVAHGFGHGRRRRKRNSRCGMPSAEEHADNACDDGDEKCTDKQIGRNRESAASFAHAAEIEDGDDDQNANAERNGVRAARMEPPRSRRRLPRKCPPRPLGCNRRAERPRQAGRQVRRG